LHEWYLDKPEYGLHAPPEVWLDIVPGVSPSILLVLASHPYEEADYIRSHAQFEAFAKRR
jgi:hypothetical protein